MGVRTIDLGQCAVRQHRVDLLDLADQIPHHIDRMRRLLEKLPAGPGHPTDPSARIPASRAAPVLAHDHAHDPSTQYLLRQRGRAVVAQLISHTCDRAPPFDLPLDPPGGLHIYGHRLLHEERQPSIQRIQLRRAMCEHRDADVHRVEIRALQHRPVIRVRVRATPRRGLLSQPLLNITRRDHPRALHLRQSPHMAPGVAAASDTSDPDLVGHRSSSAYNVSTFKRSNVRMT